MREFVPARRLRGIQKSLIRQVFDRALPGSINLGLGEPDLATPEIIRREAARIVLEEQNGYTNHAGLPALRKLVAQDYPIQGFSTEEVIITAGSQEALYLALMSMVDDGDEVMIPDPGFVAYPTLTQMAGGTPVRYQMPADARFGLDIESFKNCLSDRTRLVVCISPSNPTGRTLWEDDLRAIASALEGTGIWVISDEIYRDLYFSADRPPTLADFYNRTIVIGGLSKSLSMTGWRIGWMCGAPEVMRAALVLHGYVTTCASTVSQKTALVAWSDAANVAKQQFRTIFKARRDFLVDQLRTEIGVDVSAPDGAFYLMVNIEKYGLSLDVAEALLEHNVITVPGVAFGEQGEGFIRVSFCAHNDVLAEGVSRIGRGLASLKGIRSSS